MAWLSHGCLMLLICVVVSAYESDVMVTSQECGRSKACLQPSGCSGDKCPYFASWKKVMMDGKKYIEFELEGFLTSAEGYIAVVLSNDNKEGDDAIIACYNDNRNNKVVIVPAYSKEDKSTVDEDWNTIIRDPPEDYLITSGKRLGGSFSSIRRIQCRFRRQVTPTAKVDVLKDLTTFTPTTVRVIRGPAIVPGLRLRRPFGGETVNSPEKYDIAAMPVSSTKEGRQPLAKTHGCLMILAWVLCSSIGIFTARYYKSMWPNNRWMDERTWFYIHTSLQSSCVIMTILGAIIIFIHAGGYAYYDHLPQKAHPILGIIVLCLAFLNPLIALCRCSPGHRDRPIFNWFHFLIGTIAHVLAIPTVMIGFRMPDSGTLLPQMDLPLWILIFFIIFQLICEIILEIHGCCYYRKNKNKRQEYETELRAYENKIGPKVTPREPEPSGRTFKTVMLGLYCTVTAAVAFALVIIVAVY